MCKKMILVMVLISLFATGKVLAEEKKLGITFGRRNSALLLT